MASVTNTTKAKSGHSASNRVGHLTLQIVLVNLFAPLVLFLGVLYMGQYRDQLVHTETEKLLDEAQFFAEALAESAVMPALPSPSNDGPDRPTFNKDLTTRLLLRLSNISESHAQLYDHNGALLTSTDEAVYLGPVFQQALLLEQEEEGPSVALLLAYLGTKAMEMVPTRTVLPHFPLSGTSEQDNVLQNAHNLPDAASASKGIKKATAWKTRQSNIILTSAAPIVSGDKIIGVIHLIKSGHPIEMAMVGLRFDILTIFLTTMSATIFLSLFMAAFIARPLNVLGRAAEQIRIGKARHEDIPDLSHRSDAIGALSIAIRDMTLALSERMDSIERFAADVAHELKNPLTSLRSAVETIEKVDDPDDRKKLMEIILHDVQRLDRLISDISNASRLDAELNREELKDVDLQELLLGVTRNYQGPKDRIRNTKSDKDRAERVRLDMPTEKALFVRGNPVRLAQVFENLISNALSFSPPDKAVIVRTIPDKKNVWVSVEDSGPGIPENKRESIFERFYSERPKHESYGGHSGLGLSIVKQIVKALGATVEAENLYDSNGSIKGACFTVCLQRVKLNESSPHDA